MNHGGKVVICSIGFISSWLYVNSANKEKLKLLVDDVENSSSVSPDEIEELRCVNNFPPQTFDKILEWKKSLINNEKISYPLFVTLVSLSLPHSIQNGYILDRIIFGSKTRDYLAVTCTENIDEIQKMDPIFLLTCFSVVFNTTIHERVEHLWRMIANEDGDVAVSDVTSLVDYLIATYQIPSKKNFVINKKWLFHEYSFATGEKLVQNAIIEIDLREERKKNGWVERSMFRDRKNIPLTQIDKDKFFAILTSDTVCAWGECFDKKLK